MAAAVRVPFAIAEPWPAALAAIKEDRFHLVALTPRQPSQSLESFAAARRPARLAILVGAEYPGLSEAALEIADVRVRIPTFRSVDSLNLAVATGIVLSRLQDHCPPPD